MQYILIIVAVTKLVTDNNVKKIHIHINNLIELTGKRITSKKKHYEYNNTKEKKCLLIPNKSFMFVQKLCLNLEFKECENL